MPTLAERVLSYRKGAGLTQAELGKLVGARQQTIDKIEKGRIQTPECLVPLARVMGVEPETLLRDGRRLPDIPLHGAPSGIAVRHLAAIAEGILEAAIEDRKLEQFLDLAQRTGGLSRALLEVYAELKLSDAVPADAAKERAHGYFTHALSHAVLSGRRAAEDPAE